MPGRAINPLGAALAVGAWIVLGACGGGRDDAAVDSGAAATATAPTTDSAAGSVAAGNDMMTVTGGDTGVVALVTTVDQSEVEAGRLARTKARNAQVKAFARTLVDEHSQAMRKAGELARTANIPLPTASTGATGTTGAAGATATTGDTSRAATTGTPGAGGTTGTAAVGGPALANLQSMHSQAMTQLRSATGADFDRAFMDSQVQGHQTVLDLLNRAQGQVQNAALRQHLTEMIPKVQQHLDRARQLQGTIAGTGTGTDTARSGADTARKGS